MLIRDFDFELPDGAIAQEPAPRGTSRLLVLDAQGEERHRQVADLPSLLAPGDLLVANDTRVIPARLFGRRPGGGAVELLLVERRGERQWDCLVKPGKRARPGMRLAFDGGLEAAVLASEPTEPSGTGGDGRRRVEFSAAVEPFLEAIGHVPLPPYIKRPDRASDRETYQTLFAARPGAIAAPTAGLHFSPEIVARLAEAGIALATVTLHVGIGTFKPVTAELVHEHVMEEERYEVPEETAAAIAATRARGGRIVAVGTTVVRTLESTAAAHGGAIVPGTGRTSLFITPGFDFRAVDLLLTNFHLPRSSLLLLVSAFAGRERVLAAYREAIAAGYRFYSYGDAMLAQRAGLR